MGHSIQPRLHGKPAYRIKAEKIRETDKAILLNCEGDEIWIPKSQVSYNDTDKTAKIPEWLYNNKFQNG